ncbi:hypothetical protein KIW84_010923 [Lathyrus oleraceus]|uniref:Uncharacterized protein n=1 Tax=Pisum sativum TaxID=3888 RepID=A0A9D4YNB2_PEA|nr:hypothetical protein KIW84_010923 [Pisum sativum]
MVFLIEGVVWLLMIQMNKAIEDLFWKKTHTGWKKLFTVTVCFFLKNLQIKHVLILLRVSLRKCCSDFHTPFLVIWRGLAAYDPNEQSYRRFVLEENTYWLEEAVYSDSLFFPKEPSDQACSHSSSGFLKKMLLRFSHTIFSHLACNATSD